MTELNTYTAISLSATGINKMGIALPKDPQGSKSSRHSCLTTAPGSAQGRAATVTLMQKRWCRRSSHGAGGGIHLLHISLRDQQPTQPQVTQVH